MTSFQLNNAAYSVPATKADFSTLVGKLAEQHPTIRSQALLFCFEATDAQPPAQQTTSRWCASMVGEGKFGTLHLVYELLGRPEIAHSGYVRTVLSSIEIESLLSAFQPFLSEAQAHPNVAFLLAARENKDQVAVTILAVPTDKTKENPEYRKFRTNLLFNLFNEGALRGSDGPARQAILDSFSYLPNNFLSAEGRFLALSDVQAPTLLRDGVSAESAGQASVGGVDKFPSLMAVRGKRLQADGNRIIPSAMIRDGVHVGKRNIFMFHAAVNIAACIGDDNMIDSHASVASAAQIGNRNKIGSFVSLEGVLSPANATPVFIGDDNFIGSFARIGTGIIVGNKNFIGAGVNLSKGTKLRDCRADAPTRGQYVNAQELNGSFNNLALAPNNAAREFNGVEILPGEYILFENSEEFMSRFEGDARIKAAK